MQVLSRLSEANVISLSPSLPLYLSPSPSLRPFSPWQGGMRYPVLMHCSFPVARPQTRFFALPHKVCHPTSPHQKTTRVPQEMLLLCLTPSALLPACCHSQVFVSTSLHFKDHVPTASRLYPSTSSLSVAREYPNPWARPGLPGIQASDQGLTSF